MAAAVALVRRGCRPTVLDAGLTPDQNALSLKSRLASAESEDWKEDELESVRQTGPVAANGIPRKLYFGSDFAFRAVNVATPLELQQASVHRSFAAGGFSNVWGAVIQALPGRELMEWPVSSGELSPHYDAVRVLLCDGPEGGGGTVETPAAPRALPQALHPSSQARGLYADLSAGRQQLERAGFQFEYPQLAVRADESNGRKGCRYCGLCLYGCPYDCRYTAEVTLRRLIRAGLISYEPGMVVERISLEQGQIRVDCRVLPDGSSRTFRARKILLAAGLLETTRIVLSSLRLYDTPLHVLHSDIFTLPLLRYHPDRAVFHEKMHTLCQLVAKIEDDLICAHPVHLQFYGFSDLYRRLLALKLGWASYPLAPALRAAAARLFVIFGYLHSSVSSSLTLTLSTGGGLKLHIKGQSNPEAERISRAVAGKLLLHRGCLRAMPVSLRPHLDLPGGGYHSGGVFPMRARPQSLETDRLGRLALLPGVHIVDASVLPTIPACPMAFTVMANAHRIASECPVPHV
ncbi:MAG TPA: GMC oxidoreductase [Acidobacteriota bacterium]|nr:GMC oxidoreductase [Acidobacteriota bacterium]